MTASQLPINSLCHPSLLAVGYDDDMRKPAVSVSRELQYFERVKARLRNRDAYNDLIKVVHLYNQEILSRHELVSLVTDIIGRYQDLMVGGREGRGVRAALGGRERVGAGSEEDGGEKGAAVHQVGKMEAKVGPACFAVLIHLWDANSCMAKPMI